MARAMTNPPLPFGLSVGSGVVVSADMSSPFEVASCAHTRAALPAGGPATVTRDPSTREMGLKSIDV
jgi:hypothetical protein